MTECHAVESGVVAPVNSSDPNPLLWPHDLTEDGYPFKDPPSVQTLQAWAGTYDSLAEKKAAECRHFLKLADDCRKAETDFVKQANEYRRKVREIERSSLPKFAPAKVNIKPPPGLDLADASTNIDEAQYEPKKITGLPRYSSDDSTASTVCPTAQLGRYSSVESNQSWQGGIPELSGLEGIPENALAKAFAATPHTFQAQTVERLEQVQTPGVCCFRWTISAKKLNGSDQSSVSPVMLLPSGRDQQLLPFKMILYAKPSSCDNGRGGASFRKAKGRGMIKLKSEATSSLGEDHTLPPALTFWLSAGTGRAPDALSSPRGPVTHDFAKAATGGLNTDQEAWEFVQLVDKATDTFVVCLAVRTPSN